MFLKGKLQLMQGDSGAAKITLEQARIKAENLGSLHLLWQIIANLAEVEIDKGWR